MSYHVNHQSDAIDASTPIMRSSSRISPLSVDHDHKFQRSRGFFNVEKSGSGKEGYFRRHSMRGGSRTSTPESDYGAVEDWDDLDDEDIAVNLEDDMTIADDGSAIPPRFSMQFGGLKREPNPRRWSVMEKLNRRYYCRIRSCDELTKIVNGKCLFSTLMLFVFIFLLYLVIRAVFFNKTFEPQTYDFIIIGAGPAGSVLTRKLLDSGARVLLLEAGNVTQYDLGGVGYSGSPLTVFDIPLLWTAALKFPDHTWSFLPETSNEMKQLSHKKGNKKKSDQVDYLKTVDGSSDVNFDRIGLHPIIPKGLGGGGSMNAMVYTTALESDIKRWNIPKITWKLMNETYRDLEAFYDIRIGKSTVDGRRNIGSEIISSFYTDELSKQFIESAMAAGIPYNEDFNNPNSIRNGAGYYQFRIKNGVRSSAAQTMLGPLIRSKQPVPGFNFEVEAEVKRVLLVNMDSSSVTSTGKTVGKNGKTNSFNKEGNHYYYSYGVEYEVNGIRKTALLGQSTSTYNKLKKFEGSRSVIVSAGAIMTPKLLMDSGIGDPDTLQNANIVPLVNNRNVGKNLQDHPAVQVVLQPSARLQASKPFHSHSILFLIQYTSSFSRLSNIIHISPTVDELLFCCGNIEIT
jgi:choline dehydrogenase-like flavoprotein